ncbi:DUF4185 domain-containing protein [Herbiconiux sp. KACC 21604]|uniref:DUF4185 domain-containing protein n=1 Tax=unclassified Herbiconiux TaxID=2618217 RepID=UPI0014925F84|nr:DUF4185 domain-containing protein [Herbiconiux sp. SALV-R1]QJU55619.1 DUF4185 domain-containing protein [Herbiconiux sp. SALV-R1]WPO86815.1 DUF4185 domain-containing protein [Herbiconiux sp. KACC 21604]
MIMRRRGRPIGLTTMAAAVTALALAATAVPVAASASAVAPAAAAHTVTGVSARPAADHPTLPCIQTTVSTNDGLTVLFNEYGDTAGRWTGADSSYSVLLPDGRTAWIYSDTFLGEVNPDQSRPADSPFVHNSIIVDDDGSLTTYTGGTAADSTSLVTVPGGDESQNWYWFGDGTVEGGSLRVLLLEFEKTGTGVFDFAFAGSAIASFDIATLALTGTTALPESGIHWGSAILEEGGYTYIYGVEDQQAQKWAHLARVPSGQLTDASAWRYLADGGWVADPTASKRVLEGVSNEFSVQKVHGAYLLVTGDATEALSAKIVGYAASTPEGPFGHKTLLYTTPETGGNVFTYNAKAHPQFTHGRTITVTYNVNSFDTADVYADVANYRPRYIDVTASLGPCGN